MNKTILLSGAVALLALVSCGGKSDEAAKADSALQADSLAAVQRAAEQAEQARQDSIRQDSIDKEEAALAAIPTFRELLKNQNNPALLKSRGFNVSTKQEYYEGDDAYYTHVTATYSTPAGVKVKYTDWLLGFTIKITGAPEVLNKIYLDAQKYVAEESQKNGGWWNECWSVKKKGDEVEVYFPDAC